MTFSIAAWDSATGDVGVAVASKFLAVGAVVPHAEAGVGAVATQALANLRYGADGLSLLRRGEEPITVAQLLTAADEGRDERQLGLVDGQGRAASFTGSGCIDWAGGVTGEGYAIQGNLLVGPAVVAAMEHAWHEHASLVFAERLLAVLLAGEQAGGDRRGRQSTAILVKREEAGYGGATDQLVDLRVEDHPDPVLELMRLLTIQDRLFGKTPEDQWTLIDEQLAAALRAGLSDWGVQVQPTGPYDAELEVALRLWVGNENLEDRWYGGDHIDPVVVAHLLSAEA